MTKDEIEKIIKLHLLWLRDNSQGVRADLSRADLSGVELSGANLSRANLSRANLSRANLSWANLSRADLSGANLSRADLSRANLSWANLSWANLSRADLSGVDLSEANLSRANLSGVDLSGANLSGANLYMAEIEGATLPHYQICPERGAFDAWKCVECAETNQRMAIRVRIPAKAKRTSSLIGRKCRASEVKVLEGHGRSPTAAYTLEYKKGEVVKADKFDPDPKVECTHGIHFFMTKKEAEEWSW